MNFAFQQSCFLKIEVKQLRKSSKACS